MKNRMTAGAVIRQNQAALTPSNRRQGRYFFLLSIEPA
jgi:hypothetical protein